MKLLALDSGLERCGYAVFEKASPPQLITYGCIQTSKADALVARFLVLYKKIEGLILKHQPDRLVIERLFFTNNQKTAITVAQTQGVALTLAAMHTIPVEFITPTQIKQSVTGYGKADKKQVQKMLMLLLPLTEIPKPDDTADAIACGLAYCSITKFI